MQARALDEVLHDLRARPIARVSAFLAFILVLLGGIYVLVALGLHDEESAHPTLRSYWLDRSQMVLPPFYVCNEQRDGGVLALDCVLNGTLALNSTAVNSTLPGDSCLAVNVDESVILDRVRLPVPSVLCVVRRNTSHTPSDGSSRTVSRYPRLGFVGRVDGELDPRSCPVPDFDAIFLRYSEHALIAASEIRYIIDGEPMITNMSTKLHWVGPARNASCLPDLSCLAFEIQLESYTVHVRQEYVGFTFILLVGAIGGAMFFLLAHHRCLVPLTAWFMSERGAGGGDPAAAPGVGARPPAPGAPGFTLLAPPADARPPPLHGGRVLGAAPEPVDRLEWLERMQLEAAIAASMQTAAAAGATADAAATPAAAAAAAAPSPPATPAAAAVETGTEAAAATTARPPAESREERRQGSDAEPVFAGRPVPRAGDHPLLRLLSRPPSQGRYNRLPEQESDGQGP